MKIALVTHWLSRTGGGISTVVESLSRILQDKHCDVEVLGLWDADWEQCRLSWNGAAARAFRVVGAKSLGYSPELRTALFKSKPDVVHLHGIWMHPSSDVLRWSGGTRGVLISPHGMLDPWAVKQSGIKKRLARVLYEDRALKRATCIHALCRQEAEAIRAFGLTNPICIIPNGVNIPTLVPSTPAPWKNLVADESRVILFLGRLHPKKNVHGLVNAIGALKTKNELGNWRLVIVGWDQLGYGKKLAAEVVDRGLSREVVFLGPLYGSEKRSAISQASAFVLPSFSEGLPMAVLEAWSYGVPVLMSRACNLPEGFEFAAALESGTEAKEIESALRALIELDSRELCQMGANGRNLVSARFSWASTGQKLMKVYEWVVEGGMPPDDVEFY